MKLILALALALAITGPAISQYYPRPYYADDKPSPVYPHPAPRPCWNCDQSYPGTQPTCPYCGSPRKPPPR